MKKTGTRSPRQDHHTGKFWNGGGQGASGGRSRLEQEEGGLPRDCGLGTRLGLGRWRGHSSWEKDSRRGRSHSTPGAVTRGGGSSSQDMSNPGGDAERRRGQQGGPTPP